MFEAIQAALTFIWQTLLAEFIVVVVGVITARFIMDKVTEIRYGRWVVDIVRQDGSLILTRKLTANKAQQLLPEESDLNPFLKGLVSPYAVVHCDLVTEGLEKGVVVKDDQARRIIIRIIPPEIEPLPPGAVPPKPSVTVL